MLKIQSALCHTVLENECSCMSAAACRGCSHPVDAIANTQILALADSPLDLHVPLLQGDEHFILLLGNVKHVLQEEEQAADSERTDARTHARAADSERTYAQTHTHSEVGTCGFCRKVVLWLEQPPQRFSSGSAFLVQLPK